MSHATLIQTQPGEFEFRMPDLGEGVMEGEIVKWLVAEGDAVAEDQPIVEIMTDKATMEIPAPTAGTIRKRFNAEGEMAKVGEPLVLIASEGAAAPAPGPAPASATATAPAAAAATAAVSAAPGPVANGTGNGNGKALAAPATRKLARELGVDLASVPGSGPHGRVTQDDVRAAAAGTRSAGQATAVVSAPQPASSGEERIPLRGLRRKIAEKMVQSAFTAPHVTTFDEVDMTALVALRARLKPKAEALGVKLSYMPFIMKAVVAALRQFPHFNASLDDATNELVVKRDIHMGFAAATDNGLLVPVVRDADKKSLLTLAREMNEVAERTRTGKASSQELSGSTFTISNVGSVGGLFATPIINHPEVAILGVNAIQKRAVVVGGAVEVRDMMYLGLSFDHRVNDGAEAVRFLATVISYMQDPDLLLLEV